MARPSPFGAAVIALNQRWAWVGKSRLYFHFSVEESLRADRFVGAFSAALWLAGASKRDEFRLREVVAAWAMSLRGESHRIGLLGGKSSRLCTWLQGSGLLVSKVRTSISTISTTRRTIERGGRWWGLWLIETKALSNEFWAI